MSLEIRAQSLAAIIAAFAVASPVLSQPVQWRTQDGGNGHWYQITETIAASFSEARQLADALGGHLATLTSIEENHFVANLHAGEVWLGGFQDTGASDYSEPSGGWRWVTEEPWSFVNWYPGEPNDGAGSLSERALTWWGQSTERWNDVPAGPCDNCPNMPAAIEWSADCNGDGIVDKGQILSGQLADVNSNGVPDSCEAPQPVQWRVQGGGNGHWYQLVTGYGPCWEQQRQWALDAGGYLATITSEGEYNHLVQLLAGNEFIALGGFQSPGSQEPGGGWSWVTGEVWNNAAPWAGGQPENHGGTQAYLILTNSGCHDGDNCPPHSAQGYFIEWSADCNGDGIVDKGQILSGQLADLNNNGVPDGCEGPCEFRVQPQSVALVPGNPATFSVGFGRAGSTLHWRKDGLTLADNPRISGASSATLTIASVQASDQGTYDCIATNACGEVTSQPSELSCRPIILDQPPPASVLAPGLRLSVAVPPGASSTYRWRYNGQVLFNVPGLISGATTHTLTLQTVDPSIAGTFDCVLTNACGITTSGLASAYCPADFNQDFNINPDDLGDMINCFFSGTCVDADFNRDGNVDPDDLGDYLNSFFSGC